MDINLNINAPELTRSIDNLVNTYKEVNSLSSSLVETVSYANQNASISTFSSAQLAQVEELLKNIVTPFGQTAPKTRNSKKVEPVKSEPIEDVKPEPTEEASPEPVTETEPEAAEDLKPETTALTLEVVTEHAKAYITAAADMADKKARTTAVKTLVQSYGVASLSELDAAVYPEFLAKVDAL